LEEVDVVHEEEVGFAKTPPEICRGSVLNGGDELVGELLRSDEGDSGVRPPFEDVVPDGLHEVRLAEAGVAVDEERVVDLAWCLGYGVRGGGRKLVRLTNDEVIKSVSIA